jgi:transcriptional regulator with XRE-family HTH domain
MAVSLEDKLDRLPGKRRAKVDARAAELIAEEMTLRDLRRALDRTQVHLARELGVKQETVSRLEKRSDMLLSTLRGYIEAMGGELDLLAKFPDRPPVRLKMLAAVPAQKELSAGKPPARASPTANACQEIRRRGLLTTGVSGRAVPTAVSRRRIRPPRLRGSTGSGPGLEDRPLRPGHPLVEAGRREKNGLARIPIVM